MTKQARDPKLRKSEVTGYAGKRMAKNVGCHVLAMAGQDVGESVGDAAATMISVARFRKAAPSAMTVPPSSAANTGGCSAPLRLGMLRSCWARRRAPEKLNIRVCSATNRQIVAAHVQPRWKRSGAQGAYPSSVGSTQVCRSTNRLSIQLSVEPNPHREAYRTVEISVGSGPCYWKPTIRKRQRRSAALIR
jgi:hypothetical protein